MAEFEVCELQGMRWVQIRLRDETVRAEAGALSHMQGDIRITARLPSVGSAIKSMISDESLVRPSYTGTGIIHLEPSMGGYHKFEVAGDSWILENGAYWASDGGVQLGLFRERVWTSFWAGEGPIDYQTTVSGQGCVVLNAPGPVEEVTLAGDRLSVEGKLVIARTEGLDYRVRRATKFLQSFISGEGAVRTYQGEGKALVCWTPYWTQYMMNAIAR
ncbi:MAG: AIM24 family protein [Geminicoccaceae bacterium]